jgi:DNA primase
LIPRDTIDKIFQTARVEEVIGDFVTMKRSGSNFKAKSPFSDERTPSFMVSPAKQIWKCFSTGKGGNVVSFLMEHEHFSYVEALKWLANKYNIEIREDRELTPEELERNNLRENLSIVNEFANKCFVSNLSETDEGREIGLSYFIERGFREDTIRKFQLGYCPERGESFTDFALGKGYKIEYLERAGLTKIKDDRHFDFFRGRVMFPIHSIAGKVLGFGGRTLKKDAKVAKYFNSPETELYHKSDILYGLFFAKNSVIKNDRCLLVEGYTDVISMHQAGIENVVASSGTALTPGQITLIKRYTDNITILYDGDAAGIRASFRGIDLILEQGMNVRVVLFPDGDDPDSFSRKHSSSEVEKYIADASSDFIAFKSNILVKEADNDPIKKAALIRDIVQSVALIPDPIKRQVYIRECSMIFNMEEQVLTSEMTRMRIEKTQKSLFKSEPKEIPEGPPIELKNAEVVPVQNKIYPHEYDIIRILLNYGLFSTKTQVKEVNAEGNVELKDVDISVIELVLHELERDKIEFENTIFSEIYTEILKGLAENILYGHDHFFKHQNDEVARTCAEMISVRHELSPNWWAQQKVHVNSELDNLDRAVIESIFSLKHARVIRQIEEVQKDIQVLNDKTDPESENEMMMLLARQRELDRTRLLFAEKLGRTIVNR